MRCKAIGSRATDVSDTLLLSFGWDAFFVKQGRAGAVALCVWGNPQMWTTVTSRDSGSLPEIPWILWRVTYMVAGATRQRDETPLLSRAMTCWGFAVKYPVFGEFQNHRQGGDDDLPATRLDVIV